MALKRGVTAVSALSVAIVLQPEISRAQDFYLRAGTRIRVTTRTAGYHTYVGTFLDIMHDTLYLVADTPTPTAVRLPMITVLERSIGLSPWLVYGVPFAGGVIGGVIGASSGDSKSDCLIRTAETSECGDVTSSTVVGIGAGLISAAVVSRLLARERWRDIQLSRLRPLVEFEPERLLLGARMRF